MNNKQKMITAAIAVGTGIATFVVGFFTGKNYQRIKTEQEVTTDLSEETDETENQK